MDVYDFSFFLSTMWVGPFWIAMLLYPNHEMTHKLMQGPWFFFGPIAIWYILSLSDISGLVNLISDTLDPSNALQGLADLLGTKPGASAAWAHMVAGDIFVTRWIWKRNQEMNTNEWIARASIFFGVMLMPVGIAIQMFLGKIEAKSD